MRGKWYLVGGTQEENSPSKADLLWREHTHGHITPLLYKGAQFLLFLAPTLPQ